MRNLILTASAALAIAGSAAAADLTVTVKGDDGAPLPYAVVMVQVPAEISPEARSAFEEFVKLLKK